MNPNSVSRNGILGAALAGAGLYLGWRLIQGKPFNLNFFRSPTSPEGGISTGHDPSEIPQGRKFGGDDEKKRDVVDEASWESFPASDPPAY